MDPVQALALVCSESEALPPAPSVCFTPSIYKLTVSLEFLTNARWYQVLRVTPVFPLPMTLSPGEKYAWIWGWLWLL